jgi:predicted MFS family arabinose efflux permease
VTFRDVLKVAEFRALWLADAQSLIGNQLARVALAVLVFERTGSTALTALTYALTFLPAILGGALLSGLADRYPRRRVMIWCDLVRAVLVAVMALPAMPIAALCALLVLVVFLGAPFSAAETATLPQILEGDRFVVGQAVRTITDQAGQLAGFAAGGVVIAAVGARTGLAIDAITFLLSALIIWSGVRQRPSARNASTQDNYLCSLAEDLRLIVNSTVLRTLLAFGWLAAFYIAPEGLAAPYAAEDNGGAAAVGLLLAALPAGTAVGTWLLVRLFPPPRRVRMIGPLAVAAGLALLPCVLQPNVAVSCALWFGCGLCCAYQVPAAATFVQATPEAQRGQVYGLASAGLIAVQGAGIVLFGLLGGQLHAHGAVALAGAAGAVAAAFIAITGRIEPPQDRASVPAMAPMPVPAGPHATGRSTR